MNIVISTGIYPPKIGGPAEYSKNLKIALKKAGNNVKIATFSIEDHLPTGIRHLYFFIKIIPKITSADLVIAMDTFSAGLPTILLCKLFRKKSIIRTGGDFLWEQYVERTKEKVFFRNFYEKKIKSFSLKEKIIFKLTRWTLNNASRVIFSTEWQRGIFIKAYNVEKDKTGIIENYYGEKESNIEVKNKTFIASGRGLVWKNIDTLKDVFEKIESKNVDVELFTKNLPYEIFMDKMKNSYAVILVSIGDISPNFILDAIRNNKPFICTKEVGIYDRIKDAGIFVDPLNKNEIEDAVNRLLNPDDYKIALEKVKHFSFTHNFDEIALEFLKASRLIKK